jgi:predicted anti-sigma-YlaC factor YlaD
MKCDDFQLMISTYIDDALDTASQGTMFAHLGECGGCRLFLRRMLDLRAGLTAIPAPEVPPSLDRSVMRLRMKRTGALKGAGERIRTIWLHRLSVPLPSAALIALALIMVTVLSISLWQKPDVVSIPCLPAVDVYGEQQTNPATSE